MCFWREPLGFASLFSTYRPIPFRGFDPEFGAALDRALGGAGYSVERAWESADSHCHVLDVDGKGQVLLKRAVPGKSLGKQVEILRRIFAPGSALAPLFPAFYGTVEGYEAILIEFVPGMTLREALKHGKANRRLVGPTLGALRMYHREEGAAIGDFHGGNVLVDQGRIVLIDPSEPDRHGMGPGEVPLSTDLGHWVASGAANFMSDCRRAPLLAWRLFWFNRVMFRDGIRGTTVTKAAVMKVAREHLGVLRTDPFRMSRISYFPGRVYLEVLGLSVRA